MMKDGCIEIPIKKKWFDMIREGIKKEEYRDIKKYWISRLIRKDMRGKYLKPGVNYKREGLDAIVFVNGYGALKPRVKVKVKSVKIKEVKKEWAPEGMGGMWFAIELGDIIWEEL
jgi:hypothetical protein